MSQTIIKVPGMFKADEYNTPLAKTSDIKDDIQNKYQSEINEELYQSLTGVVTEYATDAEIRALFSNEEL